MNGSAVQTFLVFRDLPFHTELRMEGFPLLEVGTIVDFDLRVPDPSDRTKTMVVFGDYVVASRKLQYRDRLRQYLELDSKKRSA